MPRNYLIEEIRQVQPQDLDTICDALQSRYGVLYPDEEILFLSLPRNNREERLRILQLILDMESRK